MKLIRELKFMKKKESYTKSPNIKDQINNSKKFAEGLKKIISCIEDNKIRTKKKVALLNQILLLDQILLIYHG